MNKQDRPRSFVPIHKRMVAANVKRVSRGHFKDIFMQIGASETLLRHGDGGFKQMDIPNARGTAVATDLVKLNVQNLG